MALMRSGVGTVWPLTLDFFLDFEEAFFFLVVVEDVCAAPGWPAPDTTAAGHTTRGATKRKSKVRLLIVRSSLGYPGRGKTQTFVIPRSPSRPRNDKIIHIFAASIGSSYCSGAGTTPAR